MIFLAIGKILLIQFLIFLRSLPDMTIVLPRVGVEATIVM